MKLKLLFFTFSLLVCSVTIAQKKNALKPFNSPNQKINEGPLITLPQVAVKVNISIVEFTYKEGKNLRTLLTNNCGDAVSLKKSLEGLEKKYDINTDIVTEMLLRNETEKEKEIKKFKLDKDIKNSFISMADYTKMYRYRKAKAVNSNLLNLEYDENGVLIASKFTDESKLIPGIFSVISGAASIIGAGKSSALAPSDSINITNNSTCLTIHPDELAEVNHWISELDNHLGNVAYSIEKPYLNKKTKCEEEIVSAFELAFYKKETRVIPVEIIYLIPREDSSTESTAFNTHLFSFDSNIGKIKINNSKKNFYLYTPSDRIIKENALTNPYILEVSNIPDLFDRNASLAPHLASSPSKITAVFNIPKRERIRLKKPLVEESVFDTIVKVPQHGSLGYYSMRLSTSDLTYDTNGEIKKLSIEKKSVLDTSVGSGATAISELITATKKEKAQTEMEILEVQVKKLELLKKLKELEQQQEP